jgi:hypothetical protein
MSTKNKFTRGTAKYTWQDCKTNADILREIKINSAVKKIQNYRNKWIQNIWQKERDRQTTTLNYEISTMWETKPKMTPQKTS